MEVTVIGTGNVGTQFGRIFYSSPISSRALEKMPLDSDLYIIAVSDAALPEVAAKMPEVKGIVVHTTGSVGMDVLRHVGCRGYGVLYPFQTISKARNLPPSSIPLLIEGSDRKVAEEIRNMAADFGFTDIQLADSEMRRRVHLSAVFACNFSNAMIAIGQKLLDDCGLEPSILNPLLGETFEKVKSIPARLAQTGPASRKDFPTMQKHLSILRELELPKECYIYEVVSDYIIDPDSSESNFC